MKANEIGFSQPAHSPYYPPPPYLYRNMETILAFWKGKKEILRQVLPEPLELDPRCEVIGRMIKIPYVTGWGSYNLGMILIRAKFKDVEGAYCCHCYMDNDSAMSAGREIWGVPKKMAKISFNTSAEVRSGTVERGGVELMTLRVNLLREAKPEELPGGVANMFCLKLIPSAEQGRPPDVKQLVRIWNENCKASLIASGNATVEFGKSPSDRFYLFEPVEMLNGYYIYEDADLPYGEVLYDYLKERK